VTIALEQPRTERDGAGVMQRAPGQPRGGSPGDLRLLLAACVGWASVAVTVSRPGWSVALALSAMASALGLLALGNGLRPGLLRAAALTCAVVALLQVAFLGQQWLRESGPLSALATDRAAVRVEGVVRSEPFEIAGGRGDSRTVLVRLGATRVEGRGQAGSAHAPVLLRGGPELLTLRWHSTVSAAGTLAPADPGAPEIAALRVRGQVQVLAPAGVVARGTEHLRAGLRQAVDGVPADARGLLPGLVIGDTSRTPPDLTEAMRATGLTHLTAVSGLISRRGHV
jgi:competence protein ComEC